MNRLARARATGIPGPKRHWQARATDLHHHDMRNGVTRWVVALFIAVGVLGVVVFAAAALFVGLFVLTAISTPHPGAPVAEKIRAADSPIVLEVQYQPAIFGADVVEDSLVVVLTDGATEAQALDLWCTVIVPAGGDQLPHDMLYVEQGEKPVPGGGGYTGGHTVLPQPTTIDGKFSYVQPTCPASASGTPSP